MIGRRAFVRAMTIAGAASIVASRSGTGNAEPPPETTRIRLAQSSILCLAPQYVAEELLRGEGFTDVRYEKREGFTWQLKAVAAGELDLTMHYAINFIRQIDAGDPVVLVAGVHAGCYELFGTDRVRAVRDLRDRKVAVPELGVSHHVLVSMLASYVGVDPKRDIEWVVTPLSEAKRLLADGKVDAVMATPPDVQEMRAKKIGHVVFNSALDRPWSQYFCCAIGANKEFVRRHPVATKRAIRAMLKAATVCAMEPQRAARVLVERRFTESYEYALQTMKDVPYVGWRELDPTDALRSYSLRLREIGLIKSDPNKIIANGTDWRFFNELKKELKG